MILCQPDDIGMAIAYPWDLNLIPSKEIKALNDNRPYFIHQLNESRQFTVFTTLLRVYTTTSLVFHEQGSNSEMMSSFFSEPLHCTTQGLPIFLWKDRFMIYWNVPSVPNIENFVVQIILPKTHQIFSGGIFHGITVSSNDIQEIFEKKDQELVNNLDSSSVLTLVFPSNVRGIAISNPKIKALNVRVLVITEENKKLMTAENLEYLRWTGVRRKYIYATTVEPKSVIFKSMKDLNMNFCLKICLQKIMVEEISCENKLITQDEPLVYDNLTTKTKYQFTFYNCSTGVMLDELQVRTGVESKFSVRFLSTLLGLVFSGPGAAENCRIVEEEDGILLTWLKQNDVDIVGYKILWTVNNEQHERILSKDSDSFKVSF